MSHHWEKCHVQTLPARTAEFSSAVEVLLRRGGGRRKSHAFLGQGREIQPLEPRSALGSPSARKESKAAKRGGEKEEE